MLLAYFNLSLAAGGLLLTVVTIAMFADYFLWKGRFFSKLSANILWQLVIIATAGSVLISLIYSEYFGFIPCSLCWLQRIAIYPQALMSLVAVKMKDHVYFPAYGIALSIFGFIVALYQYVEQMVPHDVLANALPCLADAADADCAVKVIDEFGFVTFPYLSAVTFAFLIALYLYLRRSYQFNSY